MSSSPRVVVFGGSGFLGSQLVRALALDGMTVTAVARRGRYHAEWPAGINMIAGDVTDQTFVRSVTQGASAVYLMTAGSALAWEDWRRAFVDSAGTVADACTENGVGRLIYVSSIAALYLGAAGRVIDETTGVDSRANLRSYYARAKAEAEKLLFDRHATQKLPVVVMRPGIVVGTELGLRYVLLGVGKRPERSALCPGAGRCRRSGHRAAEARY